MKIMVCTDFSAASATGERAAVAWNPAGPIVMFHAVDRRLLKNIVAATGGDGARAREDLLLWADERLRELVDELRSKGIDVVAELVEGDPVDEALSAAVRHEVGLIVAGVRAGKRLGRFRTLMAHSARVPLLLVPVEEGA